MRVHKLLVTSKWEYLRNDISYQFQSAVREKERARERGSELQALSSFLLGTTVKSSHHINLKSFKSSCNVSSCDKMLTFKMALQHPPGV